MSKTAAIWREDGVINYCIPAEVAANTFAVLAVSHTSWLCFVLEDMAAILGSTDLHAEVAEQFHIKLDTLRDGMVKSHAIEPRNRSLRMFRGKEGFLDGYVYGTMHPSELSAMADDLSDMTLAFRMSDQSREGKFMVDSWDLWVEAAKELVKPHEQMAPMMQRTVRQ